MQGDQPVELEEDTKKELKKTLKQAEKKLSLNKKNSDKKMEKQKKSVSESDDDIMLGDQPMIQGQMENASTDTITTTTLASTTDRQRRDTNVSENASTVATEVEETSSNDVNSIGSSTLNDISTSTSTEKTTEVPTTPTTVEGTTTKHIAAGFPIHMSQAVFKDPPVLFDQLNSTHSPRKDLNANDDHFIPPMLLVKARFTPTKPHVEETTFEIGSTDSTKEITTELNAETSAGADEADVSSVSTESANVENAGTTETQTEKPILIEKRHDGVLIKKEPEITTVTSTAASVVTSEATQSVQTEEITTTIVPETTKQTEPTTEAATVTSTEKIRN
jgi:hypothetical protein